MKKVYLPKRWYSTGSRVTHLPENWDECSDKLAAFALKMRAAYPEDVAKIKILAKALGIKPKVLDLFAIDSIDQLLDAIEFISLRPTSKPPISEFRLNNTIYRLPIEGFVNITAHEFILIDEFLQKYQNQQHSDYLYLILATMSSSREDRVISSRQSIFSLAQKLKNQKIDQGILLAAILFAQGAMIAIQDTYRPYVFPDKTNRSESEQSTITFGWIGWLMDIAESGTFGTYNECLKSDAHTLLMYSFKKNKEAALASERIKK